MKKKGFCLFVLCVFCVFASPIMTNAATGILFGSTDTIYTSTTLNTAETASSGTISIVNNGANSAFYLGVKAVDTLPIGTSFTATMKLANSDFVFKSCVKVGSNSGWTVTCSVSDTDPTVINITATSTGELTAGNKVITTKVSLDGSGSTNSTDPCLITLSMGTSTIVDTPKCEIKDDTYYCANGVECTEEEYTSQCTTTENPQTGSFLPYVVIIGGMILAGGLYMFTKRSKIYHI